MDDMISLARRLSILPRLVAKRLDSQLEAYSVSTGNYPYLLAIFYNRGCSQQLLAEKLRVDKAAVTRSLRKLVEDGYVERHRHPDSGREWQLFSTAAGDAFCRQVEAIVTRELGSMLAPLSGAEQATLVELIAKLVPLDSP
jgi:DNA-binding MarR family transcriptional regulator